MSDPSLAREARERLVKELMRARAVVGAARRAGDRDAGAEVRAKVDAAKRALGERGPVWWDDGAPDWNRYLAKNTPYADWAAGLDEGRRRAQRRPLHPRGTPHDFYPL